METILIPVDFSETSKNAVKYGIPLAKQMNAELILLHIFHIPATTVGNDPFLIPSFEEFEDYHINFLKKIEQEIRETYNFTNTIECISNAGFLVDEITSIVSKKNVDLIIMGITSANKLSELILGSKSVDVTKSVNCPVIIVPEDVAYNPIHTILFACDSENINNKTALEQVEKFVQLYNAKLLLLHVIEDSELPNFEKMNFQLKYANSFKNIEHSIHFIEGDDLVEPINEFIDNHNANLLIMIPKKHAFLSHLFRESNTKKMAFHTHVPLLTIHE